MSRRKAQHRKTLDACLMWFPGRRLLSKGPWNNLGLPKGQAEREPELAFLSDPKQCGKKDKEMPTSPWVILE